MKSATITDAKNGLSALIDLVRGGESVVITDRVGRSRDSNPSPPPTMPGRLLRLERAGTVRIGQGAPPVALIRRPAPRASRGASAVDALLDERRDGR